MSSVVFIQSFCSSPDTDELNLHISAEGLLETGSEGQALGVCLLVELVRERDLFWVISG